MTDLDLFLIFWTTSTILTLIAFGIWRFLESKMGTAEEGDMDPLLLTIFFIICPGLQLLCAFIALAESVSLLGANHRSTKEQVEQLYKEQNALFQCKECKLIQRQHQLEAEGYMHCCGDHYERTMRLVENRKLYDYALETGLTPLMSEKEIKVQLKEATQKKKVAQKKAETEKSNKEKMDDLLQKTAFIQEQNTIYLKKEYAKLEKMNAEKEQRKAEILNTLDEEKKSEFLRTIALFDELYELEIKKLTVLEQNNEEKLAALKERVRV